jgi:predicted nucleotidyltransferase
MAYISDGVVRSIQQFMTVVQQYRRVEAVYLYGSYVKGNATKWSDIDLAIVSSDFSDDLFQEQLDLMLLATQVDDRIEPRPFTPNSFNINEPLVDEIKRTGIIISNNYQWNND